MVTGCSPNSDVGSPGASNHPLVPSVYRTADGNNGVPCTRAEVQLEPPSDVIHTLVFMSIELTVTTQSLCASRTCSVATPSAFATGGGCVPRGCWPSV